MSSSRAVIVSSLGSNSFCTTSANSVRAHRTRQIRPRLRDRRRSLQTVSKTEAHLRVVPRAGEEIEPAVNALF